MPTRRHLQTADFTKQVPYAYGCRLGLTKLGGERSLDVVAENIQSNFEGGHEN